MVKVDVILTTGPIEDLEKQLGKIEIVDVLHATIGVEGTRKTIDDYAFVSLKAQLVKRAETLGIAGIYNITYQTLSTQSASYRGTGYNEMSGSTTLLCTGTAVKKVY